MRILRLKLVNFIGIKHGLDKEEIEIFFPENGNAFTMLNGGNGSGKSTIQSQLHPFKESFDDRKDLILSGKIGIKEIDIFHNGSVYEIKHIYDKTTASFIKKDGEELNENGKVRTFEDIVMNELEVTKDYFKIGKIGSNTDNFVQFSTSQRKTYISNFVQEVEKYLESFKVASGKFKLDVEKIKSVGTELSKYDTPKNLKASLAENNSKLSEVEDSILNLTGEIAVAESDVSKLQLKLKETNYIAIKKESELLNNKIVAYETTLNNINTKYNNNESFKSDLLKTSSLKAELESLTTEELLLSKSIEDLKIQAINITNSKNQTNSKLAGLSSFANSSNIKDRLVELLQYIKEAEIEYDKLEIKSFLENNISEINKYLSTYQLFVQFVLNNFNSLTSTELLINSRNIDLFFTKECVKYLNEETGKIKESLINMELNKSNLNKEYGIKSANLSKLEILEKRPNDCHIDGCPFIKDALKYKNLPDEISNIENELNLITKSLQDKTEIAEKWDELKILYKNTLYYFKNLNPQQNPIYKYQVYKYKNIVELTKLTYNEVSYIFSSIKEDVDNFVTLFNELSSAKAEYNNLNNEYEKITNSETIRNHFVEELNKNNNELNYLNNEIINKTTMLSELRNRISAKQLYLNDLVDMNEATDKLMSTREIYNEKLNIIKEYEETSINKNNIQIKLTEAKKELSSSIDTKNKLMEIIRKEEIAYARTKELNKQIKELNQSYKNLKLVKDALDPKSGIPLVFIQSYLGKTELIANELLNLAFNGQFEIHFESGPSDFFIQVRTGENFKNDIKLASQGEIALTTISISLALIEQSIGNFNILSLDEIDASLDSTNREAFISILNSQIQKLGIEQVFIISHNNAFDTIPMNLIMLNGSEDKASNPNFMENKTIIYSTI